MTSSRSKTDGKGGRSKAPLPSGDAYESLVSVCPTDNSPGNVICLQTLLDSVKNEICQKIYSLSTDLRSEIATVRTDVKGWLEPLQQMVEANTSTIKELEQALSDHSDHITELENLITSLSDRVTHLDAKCEDLEGRSRRNNLCLVGLPEGSEGSRPTEYVAQLLKEILRLQDKPLLDRAHRTLREKPKKGEPPRPLVIKVMWIFFKRLRNSPLLLTTERGCPFSRIILRLWLRSGLHSEMLNVFSIHVLESSLACSFLRC